MLSVLYLEVGRSLGLPLEGVGMPAHFIVRLMGEDPAVFIDPFHGGKILDEAGCRDLLHQVTDGRIELQPEFLRPWPALRIVDRILHNLKAIYAQTHDYRRARRVVDQILVLRPDGAEEIRDRGMLAYQALLFGQAVEDLEIYLELAPRASDATAIRGQLQSLRRLLLSNN
jgi:regulator of sirC expression with transglutaminase-like and TPR domain